MTALLVSLLRRDTDTDTDTGTNTDSSMTSSHTHHVRGAGKAQVLG